MSDVGGFGCCYAGWALYGAYSVFAAMIASVFVVSFMSIAGEAKVKAMDDDAIIKKILELNQRLAEDSLYEKVLDELNKGDTDVVAQARALEEAQGEREKARAFYIKHRIRRLKDIELAGFIEREALRAQERAQQEDIERKRKEDENRNFLIKKIIETGRVTGVVKRAYQVEFTDWLRKEAWDEARNDVITNNDLWIEFFRVYLRKLG